MHNVSIETSQNVLVNYNIASVGDRVVAFILDVLVIIAFTIAINYILSVGGIYDEWVSVVFISLPILLYHFLFEIFMNGQSPGKRARKMKVSKLDGTQPNIGSYILRAIFRPIDAIYGLGLLVIIINGKGQRIGDLAAQTTVISLKQKIKLSDTLLIPIPADHEPRFPQVVELTDEQAAFIKDVISGNKAHNRHIAINILAKKVARKLQLQHDLRPYKFLETVLKDFNYYTSK